jgi:uncharacterized DUF497 family protein
MTERVEWDEAKNVSSQAKHGVTFEQASALFAAGNDYLEILDAAHTNEEDRFIAIGPIALGVVLVVWTERDEDVIRIISARWATKGERTKYLEYMERQP